TAQDLNDHLVSHYVPDLNEVSLEGVKQPPPSQLPWYPNGFGWQINVGKHVIRKSPEYKKLQQFLVYETEVGNLSRQEAVSMIPPLLLEVEPHHLVLDMCAAPGSKTAQLLEALHASSSSATNATPPSGLVVANDSDLKRSQLLVHQSSRLPSANVIVTNLDASRVNGTMRKNAQIWNKWMVGDANGLHSLQLRILLRGMDLLKPGGRLVYSTCSFNPTENESVVAAALRKNKAFKIVDASASLPNLVRAKGLTTWKAAVGKDCLLYDTYEEFCAAEQTTEEIKERNHETMWPKGDEVELGLEKCLRLYPHLQDTGGFFVTVLEKALEEVKGDEKDQVVVPEPAATAVVDSIASTEPGSTGAPSGEPIESTTTATTSLAGSKRVASPSLDASPSAGQSAPKKARSDVAAGAAPVPTPKVIIGANMNEIKPNGKPDGSFKEKPYVFMDAEGGELNTAIEHFGLKSTFSPGNLYVRNETGEALRSVYYTSDLIKTIIKSNEYTRLRLVSAGVKLFAHQDSPGDEVKCKWRACAEGLEILLPFLGEGKTLKAGLNDLKILMESHYPM
ncbi:S-adenosyl-L-methionine-dependent methyltransferase, partial [Mrakia frigida]|uniref:S-adenosyl-L-methionine-dependent methyltransferase n=1 Tax=Mrakia frigida TaxID=29902 RepID=UPI003FCC1886